MRMSLSHLLHFGIDRMQSLDVEEVCRLLISEILSNHLLSGEVQAKIVRCAAEMATVDPMDILGFVQAHLEFCNVTVHPGTIVKVSSEDSDASLTMVLPYDTDVCEIDAVLDQIREDKRGYGPAERERFRLNFADIIYGYFHDNGLRPASMNYDVDEAV